MILFIALLTPAGAAGQTITGTLVDAASRQPIPLGLVLMYTESGDSVTSTITDERGRFRVTSPEPGSFLLRGAALGYRETPVGVFDLGPGGSMSVEFRLESAPLPVDPLLVEVDRPVLDHRLVRNGFVRRLQRGLGKFITPYDLERSPARSTEALLEGVVDVRVGMVKDEMGLPLPHLGETVQIRSPRLGWCNPTVYVDGIRVHYDPSTGSNLSSYAHIGTVEALEVFRSAAEVPVEFSTGQSGCGVLVVWTKQGLGRGQRAEFSAPATAPAGAERATLPEVPDAKSPLVPGERIRLQVDVDVARARGIDPIWNGLFTSVASQDLVVQDPESARLHSIPLEAVNALQVSRAKDAGDALKRGAVAGTLFGLGTAGFLSLLCEFSCGSGANQSVTLPAIGVGVLTGILAWSQGPGTQWVRPPLPPSGGSNSPR